MKPYKLRVYKLTGSKKGTLDHEEFFDSKEDMDKRYNELFVYENMALNPTAWKRRGPKWVLMSGY